MRNQFINALVDLAERDERVLLLTGDLGYTVIEPFAERFADRFVNVGVAEQNMVAMATGLAEAGFVPYLYSIATFASMRAYEFVRNGPVLHELPVRIVGVGGGLDYGHNGVTHFALEDVALMRAQPGMTVVAPADAAQAVTALNALHPAPTPVYFRLGRHARLIEELAGRFEPGRAELIGDDDVDVVFVALGTLAHEALEAAAILDGEGIAASVVVLASVAPAPVDDLISALGRARLVVTIEAHYAAGGIGSLVAEVIAEQRLGCRLFRCAVPEVPRGITGDQNALYRLYGLTGPQLATTAVEALELSKP